MNQNKIQEISCQELHDAFEAKQEMIILDVRNEHELQFGQISTEQILIPLSELPERIAELLEFKDQEIIVYCRSGGRSARATEFLQEQGFTNVKNLKGGILTWKKFDPSIIPY